MRTVLFFGLVGLSALPACVEVPALDSAISDEARSTPYPQLVPVETVRAQVPDAQITPQTGDTLQQRADALRRKADALRNKPVIDDATRARMERGIS